MRGKQILFLLLSLIFILNGRLLKAAQIDIFSMEDTVTITLVGKIEKGDADKFQKIVQDLRQKKRPVNMLTLASSGGDANEAMRIGKIVRKSFIPTHAPFALDYGWTCNGYPPGLNDGDCDCASACFLIWVAGVYRMGNVLGVHRPYFLDEYLEDLSESEVQKDYSLLYERIRSYLKNMDVPEHVIDEMLNTESDEITYLDWYTAKSMESVPSINELVGTSCLRLTVKEEMDYWRLLAKQLEDKITLSRSENFYFNFLKKRKEKCNECIREKLQEAQLKGKTTS
ncbi:MAG: hypothetical protein JSU91_08330 [Thermoplasmatales archaeon]|nr:MAG: hypothetical protein JSU91_08330 [Thermoplasmatales archaeon]